MSSYRWQNITMEAAFAPRDGAGALVFKNKMWLLGGWNSKDKTHFPRVCNNEVWSSTDGSLWTLEKPNTFLDDTFDVTRDWEGRHTAGYAVFQDKMWIIGGDAIQKHCQLDVWDSEDGRSWHCVNPNNPVPWGPRVLHHTVVFKDKIWVMGGQAATRHTPADDVFYNDIWNSSDCTHWSRVETKGDIWSPRGMIGGSAVFQDRIWILGGGTYNTPRTKQRIFCNDVWSSADGVRWERHLDAAPWAPRQYHDVAVFDGKLWVMEGWLVPGASGQGVVAVEWGKSAVDWDAGNRNDVWYSEDGVHWNELPGTPWKTRHAAGLFVYASALWVVAGNNMERDVWKLEKHG